VRSFVHVRGCQVAVFDDGPGLAVRVVFALQVVAVLFRLVQDVEEVILHEDFRVLAAALNDAEVLPISNWLS